MAVANLQLTDNFASTMCEVLRTSFWNASIIATSFAIEFWVLLLLERLGKLNAVQTILIFANAFNMMVLLATMCLFVKFVFDKLCAEHDLIGWAMLGRDFYPPLPKWEWDDPPLKYNLCDYSTAIGWSNIYQPLQPDSFTLPLGADDKMQRKQNSPTSIGSICTQEQASNPDCHRDVEYLTSESVEATKLSDYESQYLQEASIQNQSTVVICICYLLSKTSNRFLLESLKYFSQVHQAPIYVMINAREQGVWIDDQIRIISSFLNEHGLGQVKLCYVNNSRSKAANLNAFIDALPLSHVDSAQKAYKYVLSYDVDDRPVFNEASLLTYADSVVGKMQGGHRIVGIQGPCLECYNDTFSGLLECMIEFNDKASSGLSAFEARIWGKVHSRGSNNLVLSESFCRHRFNPNVLLEDWRWTDDMLQGENGSLAFARTMVCYGQTPQGWTALAKRRNRWVKGSFQEAIHAAFHRPFLGPTFKDWLMGWCKLLYYFVVMPIFHMMVLVGNSVIFAESGRHGRRGFLDPTQMSSLPSMAVVWNFTWPASLAIIIGAHVVNFVCVMANRSATNFLNGRVSPFYNFVHIAFHLCDMFLFLTLPFTRLYQYGYFCCAELLLERALFRQTEWVPTPKTMNDGDTSKEKTPNTEHTARLDDESSSND